MKAKLKQAPAMQTWKARPLLAVVQIDSQRGHMSWRYKDWMILRKKLGYALPRTDLHLKLAHHIILLQCQFPLLSPSVGSKVCGLLHGHDLFKFCLPHRGARASSGSFLLNDATGLLLC